MLTSFNVRKGFKQSSLEWHWILTFWYEMKMQLYDSVIYDLHFLHDVKYYTKYWIKFSNIEKGLLSNLKEVAFTVKVCCGRKGNRQRSRPLHWRHNDQDSVSNHQPHGCLLNRLFRCRSNKTSKLRVTGLCAGNSPGPVNSPHKWPVTRKMFPFDDVIMALKIFVR